MDLMDLNVFRNVVEAGGVTKAAARLGRVQSNVTARIRKLEEDLDVPLFERDGRGVRLAPAGMVLLPYAERLLEMAREAREAVRGGALSGTLRLGAMESTAAARLPGPLAAFHRRHPDITLELRTGHTRLLVTQVLAGELDAALVAGPVQDPRLEARPVFVEDLLVAMPADGTEIGTRALSLLVFQPGCSYRRVLEDWVAAHGVVPDRLVEMNSYHAILGCVTAGMGIALVPASLVEGYPGRDGLRLVPLPAETGRLQTVLVWRAGLPRARIDALAAVLVA